MYYIIYKTTNKIDGKIYIGVHQTKNIDDSYMGSGKHLKRAIEKYGVENFEREILQIFDNVEDMYSMESVLVNEEFVKRKDTYNIVPGGECSSWYVTKGYTTVRDKNDNIFNVKVDDPRVLSGELKGITYGMDLGITVRDKRGKCFRVDKNDSRYLSGELKSVTYERITVKDKDGNTSSVSIYDSRYKSGELKPVWCGKKHTHETKKKISKASSIHQKGKLNSMYGRKWLNEYLESGWAVGRKIY